jgi:hypothetical protein
MKPEPRAASLLKVILNSQGAGRNDASKAISHQFNQRAVTKAYEFTGVD